MSIPVLVPLKLLFLTAPSLWQTPLGCVPPFYALKIQQDGTTLALGSELKQMTAFNTKEYGLELTIGFITGAITSYDILERRGFILLHLTRCLLLA